jgi:hypothetical protein
VADSEDGEHDERWQSMGQIAQMAEHDVRWQSSGR